jgi:Beta-lactamase class C and other penicillin binding proteins
MTVIVFMACVLSFRSARADYFPPPDSKGGWRQLTDARSIRKLAGMSLDRLDQAWEFTQRCSQNGGLLVVRHGYLVYEKYYGRAHRNANPDMASTGKAYTSIACGIMLNEFREKIPDGLDQRVFTEKYLPEAFPLDDPRKADITARPAPLHVGRLPWRGLQSGSDQWRRGAAHPGPRPGYS